MDLAGHLTQILHRHATASVFPKFLKHFRISKLFLPNKISAIISMYRNIAHSKCHMGSSKFLTLKRTTLILIFNKIQYKKK